MTKAVKYSMVFVVALALAGCVRDRHIVDPVPGPDPLAESVEVALNLRMPATGIATRALDSEQEKSVETIDILSFKMEGGTETYFSHTHGIDINPSGDSGLGFKAYLRTSPSGEQQRIVVLVNLRDEIDAKKGSFTSGMTKDEVLASIKFDTSGTWDVGSSFRPLPMYGESPRTGVIDNSTAGTDFGTIELLRSVARIDIGLNMAGEEAGYAPQGLSNFRLEDINIYNTRLEGYAVPLTENLDGSGDVLHASDEGILRNTTLPLHYAIDASSPHGLVGGVYVSEAKNITRADENSPWEEASDPLYLIVSGYYQDQGKSWYKIDMRNTTTGDIMDVLRNHRYLVNIVSIEDIGYPTEEIARAAKSANIKAEVTHVSETGIKYSVFNDYYMLGVSDRSMSLGRLSNQHTLFFTTDYPGDWNIGVEYENPLNNPQWITLDTPASGSGIVGLGTIKFTASDYPGLYQRTAWIHITSGLLSLSVEVVQTTRDMITISLDPDIGDLFFTSGVGGNIEPREITVTWTPVDLDLVVSASGVSGYDPIVVNGLHGSVYSDGTATVTINPSAMDISDPSRVQMLGVDFKVTSAYSGTTRTRTVMLTQRHVGVSANPTKTYSMTGVADRLAVYSNDPWVATLVDQGGAGTAIAWLEENGVEVSSVGGPGNGGGEFIDFRMITGDKDNQSGVSYIMISSTTSAFTPITVAISAYWGHLFTNSSGTQQLLMYPSSSPDTQTTFANAWSHCSGLGSGWRVPSSAELNQMYVRFGSNLGEYNLRESTYISSTVSNTFFGDYYYYFNMSTGQSYYNTSTGYSHYIRCVRNP